MQGGPGVEISMRARMMEAQREVSNSTLRSAAAARKERTGAFTGVRSWIRTRLTAVGAQLASGERIPVAGEPAAVIRAG